MWKVLGYVAAFSIVAGIGGVGGWVLGSAHATDATGRPSAQAMANALYRAAQQARYEDMVTDKLATSDVAESLRKAQYERGAIRSWKVVRSKTYNPIGVTVLVEVEVQRNQKELEVLQMMRHFRFSSHSSTDRSIIGD